MITCPLCQKQVLDVYTGGLSRELFPVPEHSLQDFNCPTEVMPEEGELPRHHYFRYTSQGCYSRYCAIVLPFFVEWNEGHNTINVCHWDDRYLNRGIKYYAGLGNFQEFVRIIHKFNNLKAFS